MSLVLEKHNHPTAFVIFGGTGNLAETKLLPALLDLFVVDALPDSFLLVGVSRKELSDEEYQQFILDSIVGKGHQHSEETVRAFCSHAVYRAGDFADTATYERVKEAVTTFDDSLGQCTNKLYYLAVPPQFYSQIFTQIDDTSLMELCDEDGSWSRLLVEKPFGRDLKTAQALEGELCAHFKEEQIYRIDHYLAKDAIENIIAVRFANTVFTDSWCAKDIESISVRLLETKDVATRGSFYDGVGALRDVGQNHILQILALLTMPPVPVGDVAAMRQARARMLSALVAPSNIVRGQYEGYRETSGVDADSVTETYFRLETTLDDPNWQGVPITLEAGKALGEVVSEAVVTFRPSAACHSATADDPHQYRNVLTITFAPEQTITFTMWVKKPGFAYKLQSQTLELVHEAAADVHSPEAYERVLYDCITGNQKRFVSGEEVVAAWRFITPLLATADADLIHYAAGSTGPEVTKENTNN